ncbi:DUF6311 domain-containing protein [Asticcacaulis sp. BYS171W]|uniref:DUF6311 domain-containing protein n=1 Tax=Asticcacaulis aquaticus TaxID=2984212 RepID=A0ABT5I074_9CAUL|nr:DUF6311 domain-containing protein [Asticcacaulis aquaticus]MDC7685086.1 DUF6311 domain-containing protein [Asticcacaulis aquaticus]
MPTYLPEALKWLRRVLTVAAPIALFCLFFHVEILDPTRIGWLLDEDWGQHVLGWHAFRNVPWAWPFNYQNLLAWPTGISIIYTDSNPFFSFIFKALSPILPDNFQFIGPWFGLCVAMQFFFGYRLVRPHAPGPWAALAGAVIMTLLPALYYRMRHDTLVAHFLILWTLWIFFNVKNEKHKNWWYAASLGVTGFLHPYMLFMMAAVWGGDVLRKFIPAAKALDRKQILIIIRDCALIFACPMIALGISGAYSGSSAEAKGYGFYSMGLDAPINPVQPDFSFFIRSHPQDMGQYFEGFQYMGLGILGLLIGALLLYQITFSARQARPFIDSCKPLIIPFVCLLVIALSNHVQFYDITLLNIPLPPYVLEKLAVLRASGRFFWPIAYTLMLIALVIVYKSRPKIMQVALPAVIVIQLIDLQGFIAAMRAQTELARSTVIYDQAPDPLWDKLISGAKGVDFYPAQVHLNDKLFYEITWRAVSQKKPVNTMYMARENVGQRAIELKGREAYLNGEINNDNLYVFLNQCLAPANLQPLMREVDGVWIIPPASMRHLPLDHPEWKPIKARMGLGFLNQGSCLLDKNWAPPEGDGAWTLGKRAEMVIPIQEIQFENDIRPVKPSLRMVAKSFYRPMTVDVLINGVKRGTMELEKIRSYQDIPLPPSVFNRKDMKVTFLIHDPLSLKDVGRGDDERLLGMKLFRLTLEDAAVREKAEAEKQAKIAEAQKDIKAAVQTESPGIAAGQQAVKTPAKP